MKTVALISGLKISIRSQRTKRLKKSRLAAMMLLKVRVIDAQKEVIFQPEAPFRILSVKVLESRINSSHYKSVKKALISMFSCYLLHNQLTTII